MTNSNAQNGADDDVRSKFVRGLYRSVLKRDGEPAGVEFHVSQLGCDPSFSDAESLLSTFMGSPEARVKEKLVALPSIPLLDSQEIISVGSHCITSSFLKSAGIKRWSGPFDWIFSNIRMVNHCFSDKFTAFLDRRFHIKTPMNSIIHVGANVCAHSFYKDNFGVEFVFNHHDITVDHVYDYYVRCVSRFQRTVNGPNETLLVGLTQNVVEEDFLELCRHAENFCNTKVFIFKAFNSPDGGFGISTNIIYKQHRLFNFSMIGEMGPVNFTNPYDEIVFRAAISSLIQIVHPTGD